nr:DUF3343 domain-containing protein [uncultured Sphaerochaeta sp.]
MNQFIATFFSQYGAVQFLKHARIHKIPCRLAPVPRVLSSSCGTCAHYSYSEWDPGFLMKDLESIYKVSGSRYDLIYGNEEDY